MKALPSASGKASTASAVRAWSRSRPAITCSIGRTPPEKTAPSDGTAMAAPAARTTTPAASAMNLTVDAAGIGDADANGAEAGGGHQAVFGRAVEIDRAAAADRSCCVFRMPLLPPEAVS